jgi:hypothetical protein
VQPATEVGVVAVLFVGLAGALGWGVRGSYGHEKGATLPGAMIALSICLLSGRADWQQASVFIAMVTAAGIAFGGCMSYAKVAGYARSVSYVNAAYGLGMLAFIGGLWGGVGGCMLGLVLAGWSPWALLLVAAGVAISQQIFYYLLVKVARLRMTPPRSDDWGRSFGALVLLAAICLVRREHAGLVGLTYGFMGWGFGFLVGMFIQLVGIRTGVRTNWWRVMEMIIGFFGGLALAAGILPLRETLPQLPPLRVAWLLLGAYGTLWLIVVFHIQHNFEHYGRHGLLSRGWWSGRSPKSLTRLAAVAWGLVMAVVLTAWHFWGPESGRAATQASLLGLTGACVLLGSLLDMGVPKGTSREVNAKWFLPFYLMLAAGVLVVPPAFAAPLLPVASVPDLWMFGTPLAVALTFILAKITSSLWKEDPPYAHRRFGPGADPDRWFWKPPA